MAPIKFEDQLKEKLEKRQLNPSEDAWSRLERGLENQAPEFRSKRYWWLGIAAGFVGILFLITVLNKNEDQIVSPTIVDTQTETEASNDVLEKQQPNPVITEEIVFEENSKAEEKVQNTNPEKRHKKSKELANSKIAANVKNESKNEAVLNAEDTMDILSFEDQKAIEVAAQIKAMQQNNDSLNEVEINALLAEAQKEIDLKKLYNEATNAVDAEALLESVEFDLDKSFREKVFEALKSSYNTVKTAVAERNN